MIEESSFSQRSRWNNTIPDIFEPETQRTPNQIRTLAESLEQRIDASGADYSVSEAYLSSGKPVLNLDIGTALANKGRAVDYVRREEGVDAQNLIVAGDGGNDLTMMRDLQGGDDGRRAIIVGPDSKLRKAGLALGHGIVQPASMDSAAAVLDGLRQHLEAISTQG